MKIGMQRLLLTLFPPCDGHAIAQAAPNDVARKSVNSVRTDIADHGFVSSGASDLHLVDAAVRQRAEDEPRCQDRRAQWIHHPRPLVCRRCRLRRRAFIAFSTSFFGTATMRLVASTNRSHGVAS